MKAAAIALCATALVAAVQAYSLAWDDVEPHLIQKRAVNCSDPHVHVSPHTFHKCCKKLIDIVEMGPPRHLHPPHQHGPHHHGANESSEESGSSSSEEGHSHEREHGPHGPPPPGYDGPPPPGHHGPPPPGHRGPPPPGHHGPPPPHGPHGPPPPFGLGGMACFIQEGFENKSLISGGKIDPAAIKTYLHGALEAENATSYSDEVICEIVDNCRAKAEELLSHINDANCTSGAFELQLCLRQEMFMRCPEDYWKSSDKCDAAKEYVRECPMRPWPREHPPPPPPPMGEAPAQAFPRGLRHDVNFN